MTRTMTAKRESECSPCGQTILEGDTISKAGRKWVCGPCAALHAEEHPRAQMENPRSFEHYSEQNAESVQEQSIDAGCDGTCEAYVSIFTLRRWEGQGMEPRADEAPAIAESWRTKKDDDGNVIARWKRTYEVWCRHQVEAIGAETVNETIHRVTERQAEEERETVTRDAYQPTQAEIDKADAMSERRAEEDRERRRSFSPPQIPALAGMSPLGMADDRQMADTADEQYEMQMGSR